MNHKPCHPERSLAASEANSPTESKDPCTLYVIEGNHDNFHVLVRFFDDHDAEVPHVQSREAAEECSPRRKPWEESGTATSPEGAKENAVRYINAVL